METPAIVTKDVERYQKILKGPSLGPHTYTVLLGLDYYDLPNIVKAIQKGFRWKSFERFVANIALPPEMIAEIIGIPKRTLARRKAEGRLKPDESDRLLRLARVFAKALLLFEGDAEAARLWLTDLNMALGNVAPIEFARTEVGAQEVEHIVGRIQHGVFS
jgi:putative toxin-antitoxin system antitoxin component (TIGR02293 family)